MSPHAEAYVTGAMTILSWTKKPSGFNGLVFIPRQGEYLTQETFDRMVKALARPATTSHIEVRP